MMTERKIDGFFQPYKDGYTKQINACTRLFIPAAGVSRYDPQTGELFTVAPIYHEKAPAQDATTPGEYRYYYEEQEAPTNCDYKSCMSHDGRHYYLEPLRDDLPQLHGRGISFDGKRYKVTERAYDNLKQERRISYEMCYD